MKSITVVFFGISGAGKGTQAELLIKYLAEHDAKNKVIYVETGQRFRDFMNSGTRTASQVKDVLARGALLPPFLPIWTWTGLLNDEIKTGKEHMIFDGVARQPEESPVLDSALQFYGRGKPVVLLLELHHAKAKDRLLKRGRYDDTHEKIDSRHAWFATNAMKAVDYFRTSPNVSFVAVNGDQTIPKVFEDIKKALGI